MKNKYKIWFKNIENDNKSEVSSTLSVAAEAKLRYLAGAFQKNKKRIKESVLRKIGITSKKSRIFRKMAYRKQAMLKSFRIKEGIEEGQQSLQEIEYKQGPIRGLTIVSRESVFSFFKPLHNTVQRKLTTDHFHIFPDLHNVCRNVDSNMTLADEWIALFNDVEVTDEEIDNEFFLTLIMELYRDITEHFIRISYVDALKNSKISVPLKKKQALRSKVQALGKRKDPKKGK